MRYLVDTQLLIWSATAQSKLSRAARSLLSNDTNELLFSTASIWETSIKFGRGKKDFVLRPETLRRALLLMGFEELAISSEHVIAVSGLPKHHNDPFDRVLVAQAMIEGLTLMTSDKDLAHYPSTLRV